MVLADIGVVVVARVVNHPRIELCKLKILLLVRSIRESHTISRTPPSDVMAFLDITVSNTTDILI